MIFSTNEVQVDGPNPVPNQPSLYWIRLQAVNVLPLDLLPPCLSKTHVYFWARRGHHFEASLCISFPAESASPPSKRIAAAQLVDPFFSVCPASVHLFFILWNISLASALPTALDKATDPFMSFIPYPGTCLPPSKICPSLNLIKLTPGP